MAPVAATVALSHVDGVSDSARARELYKYYQPSTPGSVEPLTLTVPSRASTANDDDQRELLISSNVYSSKISSPDTALTAFAQLVSWRTKAQRAMISVIDAETQYFIAESTKTVDLLDNTKHEPGDDIWMGCSAVSKAGRLCERTIAVAPTASGEYPSFIVNDLRLDERFCGLSFVQGPPYLKFYAGVPLITKRGIPIGSLFIVDDRVRNGLSKDEIYFMSTMASTIMRHMEMVREVEEHRRGMKMSRGLASFVEGRSELIEAEADTEEGEGTRIAGQFETDSGIGTSKTKSKAGSTRDSHAGSVGSIERKEREYSNAMFKAEETLLASREKSETPSTRGEHGTDLPSGTDLSLASQSVSSPPADPLDKSTTPSDDISEESTMKILFSRAANLIREAFEIDGGTVFYDAQRGFNIDFEPKLPNLSHTESASSSDELQTIDSLDIEDGSVSSRFASSPSSSSPISPVDPKPPRQREGMFSRSSIPNRKLVEILGFSTAAASSIDGDEYPGPHSFVPFDEKSLHTLLRRFPRGKLWTFDVGGAVSSSSEEESFRPYEKLDPLQRASDTKRHKKRAARNQSDAKFLLRHFPGVRQLLFVPLWDASRSRWLSACCAWSTEPTRVLSKQSELGFLRAFGNSVMAECSRIDTEIADQKKGDFIGSISHELRSPLHGILASAEFLSEEVTDGFSKGLVEIIDSCGRTLLDTINHILDFSKINHFEKNWRRTKRSSRPNAHHTPSALNMRQSDQPMINLFAEVDVSIVCEEIVEGVFAGHVFQNVTAKSFDMVPDARGKMSDPRKLSSVRPDEGAERLQHQNVAVVLDVDVQNYHFTTQPGAFRRVIMNLLGNALKYTSHGYVQIKLEAREMDDLITSADTIPRSMVTLTVQDTGRGISAEFLRSKLFTPFAQENSLSSGTGLGLSIVRSIVALLEGEIQIDSELGRGTQVRVTLPLLREMPKTADSGGSANTPKSNTSITREADESISLLRTRVVGQKVSVYGFDLDTKDPIIYQTGQLLKASVTNFLTNWYGLQVVPSGQRVDMIVANEADPSTISRLTLPSKSHNRSPPILVLCSHASRFDRSLSQSKSNGNCGFVAKPVGPLKLARALLQVLKGAPVTPGFVSDSKRDSSTLNPNDLSSMFEELSMSPEMLDNSRMAADSDNARKAIESPTPNAADDKNKEFPFPVDSKLPLPPGHSMPGDADSLVVKGLITNKNVLNPKLASIALTSMEAVTSSSSSTGSTSAPKGPQIDLPTPSVHVPGIKTKPVFPSPRLLLVDDNKINLKLLRTYMRKRKYDVVDEAENGLEAVDKAKARFESGDIGYDIIFMDISMPVLDGFGATRQIRALEESKRKKMAVKEKDNSQSKQKAEGLTPALVIALTGLASSRDQSEAFSSGIDLFLTKPVSFKEVGKMLDNWEANREREGLLRES